MRKQQRTPRAAADLDRRGTIRRAAEQSGPTIVGPLDNGVPSGGDEAENGECFRKPLHATGSVSESVLRNKAVADTSLE